MWRSMAMRACSSWALSLAEQYKPAKNKASAAKAGKHGASQWSCRNAARGHAESVCACHHRHGS
jgi:hypothetical protein